MEATRAVLSVRRHGVYLHKQKILIKLFQPKLAASFRLRKLIYIMLFDSSVFVFLALVVNVHTQHYTNYNKVKEINIMQNCVIFETR